MTIEELGQHAKRKYGSYEGMSDAEVGQAFLRKYPVYQKQITPSEPEKPTGFIQGLRDVKKAKEDFEVGALKGAGSTLQGASKLGQKFILNPMARLIDPENKSGLVNNTATLEKITGNRDIVTPTNTAQRVGFGAEQIAEFFIPGAGLAKGSKAVAAMPRVSRILTKAPTVDKAGRIIKDLPTATKLVKAGIKYGLKSAEGAIGFGGVTALQEGDIDKKVGENALMGAAFPIAQGLLGAGGRAVAKGNRNLAIKIANSVVPETTAKRLAAAKRGQPTLGEAMLKQGYKFGTTKGIEKQFQERAMNLDKALTKIFERKEFTGARVNKSELKPFLNDLFKEAKKNLGSVSADQSALKRIIADAPESMTLAQANELKRELYKKAKIAFLNPDSAILGQGKKAFARGIRTAIEKKTILKKPMSMSEFNKLSPADQEAFKAGKLSQVAGINQELGTAYRTSEALLKKIAQMEGQAVANSVDLLLGGVGYSAGGGGPMVGLPILRRVLMSPGLRLDFAKILYGKPNKVNQGIIQNIARALPGGKTELKDLVPPTKINILKKGAQTVATKKPIFTPKVDERILGVPKASVIKRATQEGIAKNQPLLRSDMEDVARMMKREGVTWAPKVKSTTPKNGEVILNTKKIVGTTKAVDKLQVINKTGFEKLSPQAKKYILALDKSVVNTPASGDIGADIAVKHGKNMGKLSRKVADEVGAYLKKNSSTYSKPR